MGEHTEIHEQVPQATPDPAPSRRRKIPLFVAVVVAASLAGFGLAAASGNGFFVNNGKGSDASIRCPGGIYRLSHTLTDSIPVFPGDPQPVIEEVFTVEQDGFLVETIVNGTHAGTHIDAPVHFIEGARGIDDIHGDELVWPSYVIDVRDRAATDPDFQLTWEDIRAYEKMHGWIPTGAMVIIQTGFEDLWETPDAFANGIAPGFSGDAVQRMFDERNIGGTGSDYFGPDATNDPLFDATYVTLLNDGVVLTNLNNLDSLVVKGDIIMAGAVRLENGSGFQVDPLACTSRRAR